MTSLEMTDTEPRAKTQLAEFRSAAITSSISRNAGGLFFSVRALCSSLIDNNCATQVFGVWDEYFDKDRGEWGRVPVSISRLLGPRAFGYQPELLSKLHAYDPEIVHVHGIWMYPSIAAVQWAGGKRPYVISPHGMLDPWAVRNSSWKKGIAGFLYEDKHLREAACLRALCDSENYAIRAYGLKNPVAVLPNGVDLPNTSLNLSAPDWNTLLPPGSKVLLFLGRLHPKKGLGGLLDAWAQMKLRGVPGAEEWVLVIAGWEQGGHQAQLERKTRELGIERSVCFVGAQFGTEKAASLYRADAFVLPSFSEGLPVAVLEAWSYGLPVIMTPQCNLPEGFSAGAAIKVKPEVESIVSGLASLFAMSDLERLAHGERGRRLVERKFTWAQIGAEMVAVYRWILGQGPMPDCVQTI